VFHKLSYMATHSLLDTLGETIEGQLKRRLSSQEGPPEGGDWVEYSDSYATWKAKKGKADAGFLQLEGHLVDSFHHVVTGDTLEVGSNVAYAARQHYGGKSMAPDWMGHRGRSGARSGGVHEVNVPARPYMGLSDANETEIEEAIEDWLREEMGI
jgi:phage gpG-like protein